MDYIKMDNWLEEQMKKLDISPTNYKKAVDRYMSVGEMIETKLKDEYKIDSHVYAQGSFMIGTVVKPYGKEKEYDVDLVCECNLEKSNTSPKYLKEIIGKIIQNDSTYGKMISSDEGRRTWTIEYAEDNDLAFHIDIQPSIPNKDSQYEKAILTTTKKNNNQYNWDNGNPLGFKDWFDGINASSYNEVADIQRKFLFENNNIYSSIDDIPKQLVVTKLQRLIQILKRHRDIRFEGDKYNEDKPNSMIISILATRVFEDSISSASLIQLLETFTAKISTNIQLFGQTNDDISGLLIDRINGKYIIKNPRVEENLAERWNDSDNNKKTAFFKWIEWISADIKRITEHKTLLEYENKSFDNLIIEFALSNIEKVSNDKKPPKELSNTPQPWNQNV